MYLAEGDRGYSNKTSRNGIQTYYLRSQVAFWNCSSILKTSQDDCDISWDQRDYDREGMSDFVCELQLLSEHTEFRFYVHL